MQLSEILESKRLRYSDTTGMFTVSIMGVNAVDGNFSVILKNGPCGAETKPLKIEFKDSEALSHFYETELVTSRGSSGDI
jgi:hypothetical protein